MQMKSLPTPVSAKGNMLEAKGEMVDAKEDKLYGYQDEHRFTKQELKFTMQLYGHNRNVETVIDLKLNQGHPLVFITFTRKLYHCIAQLTSYD
jgi:hypothetical protein